jgi:hypothetical protein
VSGGSPLPLPRWTVGVEETTTSRTCDRVRRRRWLWRLVHDLEIVKWTTTSTTCVFVKSSSTTFVREHSPRFRSSRVSSPLLPSHRVLMASLCSCVGKFLFSMLWTHQGAPVGLPGGVTGAVGCGYSPGEWRRGERGVGEDLGKIWGMHGLGCLLSLISQKFKQCHGWGLF